MALQVNIKPAIDYHTLRCVGRGTGNPAADGVVHASPHYFRIDQNEQRRLFVGVVICKTQTVMHGSNAKTCFIQTFLFGARDD
jgi:hypothetical protein